MADYNPIATPISSIVLNSDESEEFDIEIFQKNPLCQFERIELEESVNNVFPTGALILRDTSDIITYISAKTIKSFTVKLNNAEKYKWYITSISYANNAASEIDQTFVVIYFTNSIFFESQKTSFYDEKIIETETDDEGNEVETENTIPLFNISYPFVTTHKHLIYTYGTRGVFSKQLFTTKDADGNPIQNKGCGVNNFIKNTEDPVNYVLFRPRIADAQRVEQYQTNIISYLNYIFTYAIDKNNKKPYFMFWTDFGNGLNYKYFDLEKDLESGQFSFDIPDTDSGKIEIFSIYPSDSINQQIEIEGTSRDAKKIYVLVTNPAYSLNEKNYYYQRSSPIYLEQPSHELSGSTSDPFRLMSPFLSESDNTTLTTITSFTINDSAGPEYVQRTAALEDKNLIQLQDGGFFGYAKDFTMHNMPITVTDAVGSYEDLLNYMNSTPLGLRDSFAPNSEQTPLYPFNDNKYIWQFQYDLTRTHPNIGSSGSGITETDFYKDIDDLLTGSTEEGKSDVSSFLIESILKDVKLNKVLEAKYTAMRDQLEYDNHRRKLLQKTEKENFVSNVLCCMGQEISSKEEWFFAKITGYVKDYRTIWTGTGSGLTLTLDRQNDTAWLYSWERLEPGPLFFGLTGGDTAYIDSHASFHNLFHGWTTSICYGSTGDPTQSQIENLVTGTGFIGMDTWAINLNERLNDVKNSNNFKNYIGPGYNKLNIEGSNFKYKPIGYTGQNYDDSIKGPASHPVKMYKIPTNTLRSFGGLPAAPNLEGTYTYYFIAENAVDGGC